MYRSVIVCFVLCGLSACLPAPGSPSLLQTDVTGQWSGTFESSWGTLPITASLANERYSQSISGTYAVDGERASGTMFGGLQTHDEDSPGLLQGSLTISYRLDDGRTCRSTSSVTSGSATTRWFQMSTDGFPTGDCPNPPAAVRITLRR